MDGVHIHLSTCHHQTKQPIPFHFVDGIIPLFFNGLRDPRALADLTDSVACAASFLVCSLPCRFANTHHMSQALPAFLDDVYSQSAQHHLPDHQAQFCGEPPEQLAVRLRGCGDTAVSGAWERRGFVVYFW